MNHALFAVAALAAADKPPTLTTLSRAPFALAAPPGCPATAVVFLGVDCPISNTFAPELTRLSKEFAPAGVRFCFVYPDADVTAAAARKHQVDYALPGPACLDANQALARRLGATRKPEVAVLNAAGAVVYLGRIDDRYAAFGKSAPTPGRRELRDTLAALVAGKPVPRPAAAVGCPIDFDAGR